MINKFIHTRKEEFKALCRYHQVKFMFAFGSAVTDKFNEELSDIDLLVEIDEEDPLSRGEILISLWDKLETFFSRKVDLLTYSSIKNPYLHKSIDATKVLIYEGKGQEVLI
jgi:predicted nucleotidyltransferase